MAIERPVDVGDVVGSTTLGAVLSRHAGVTVYAASRAEDGAWTATHYESESLGTKLVMARVKRELSKWAELSVPGIVRPAEVVETSSGIVVVEPRLDATSLASLPARSAVDAGRLIVDMAKLLVALPPGLVHRALVPRQVFVRNSASEGAGGAGIGRGGQARLRQGAILEPDDRDAVTLAPEQLDDRLLEPRTMVFNCAALLLFAWLGSDRAREVIGDAGAGRALGLPDEVFAALAPEPRQRPPTVQRLAVAIERWLKSTPAAPSDTDRITIPSDAGKKPQSRPAAASTSERAAPKTLLMLGTPPPVNVPRTASGGAPAGASPSAAKSAGAAASTSIPIDVDDDAGARFDQAGETTERPLVTPPGLQGSTVDLDERGVPREVPTQGIGGGPRSDPTKLIGREFAGRYRILRVIGRGGMGCVFAAEHVGLGTMVALKVLDRDHARTSEQIDRFVREAKAASQVRHANIVTVTDFGTTDDGWMYLAMELLDGEDLGSVLRREGLLSWPSVRAIMIQLCAAVQAAHDAGVVHRDLKPENVFRLDMPEGQEVIKVLDFGIARVLDGSPLKQRTLTRAGAIFGTPEYMSPEQARGEPAGPASDIYSLGVILYELATGSVPFMDDSTVGVLAKQLTEAPPPPSERLPVPEGLDEVALCALAKRPDDRFTSADSLGRAIEAISAEAEVTRSDVRAGVPGALLLRSSSGSTAYLSGSRERAPVDPSVRMRWAQRFNVVLIVLVVLLAGGLVALATALPREPIVSLQLAQDERPVDAPSQPHYGFASQEMWAPRRDGGTDDEFVLEDEEWDTDTGPDVDVTGERPPPRKKKRRSGATPAGTTPSTSGSGDASHLKQEGAAKVRPSVVGCMREHLSAGETAITVKFSVDGESGEILWATVRSPHDANKPLQSCVAKATRGAQFAKLGTSQSVSWTYKL